MPPRFCVCGSKIPFGDDTYGPVAQISSLKFYDNAAMFGHPSSRQKVFLCHECCPRLITLLKELQRDGRATEEVSG